MEAQPLSKKRKAAQICQRIGHLPIPFELLGEIITACGVDDVPAFALREAFARQVKAVSTPYGPLVAKITFDLEEGGTWETEVINPFALLNECCRISPHFGAMLQKHCMPGVGKLIVYTDGVTIGNPCNTVAGRQTQTVYWTLLGLPSWFLTSRHGWFTLMAAPQTIIDQMPWGMSSLVAQVMAKVFFVRGPLAGVRLTIGGQSMLWRISLLAFLQDYKAFHEIFLFKGGRGTKFCFLCKNITQHVSIPPDHPYLRDFARALPEEFDPNTITDLNEVLNALEAGSRNLGVGDFGLLEQRLGMNFAPGSYLWDAQARALANPFDTVYIDWYHCLVASGQALKWTRCLELLVWASLLSSLMRVCALRADLADDLYPLFVYAILAQAVHKAQPCSTSTAARHVQVVFTTPSMLSLT